MLQRLTMNIDMIRPEWHCGSDFRFLGFNVYSIDISVSNRQTRGLLNAKRIPSPAFSFLHPNSFPKKMFPTLLYL